jgi:hypothetical protein
VRAAGRLCDGTAGPEHFRLTAALRTVAATIL